MKMTLSEVFDVVWKDLQEVFVQGQASAKDEGLWSDVPPVKSFLHCQIFKYGFKMGHFILLYIVETQKFHLEVGTLQNKSRFYFECVVGAYFCAVIVFYVQNVGPHRTFKNN